MKNNGYLSNEGKSYTDEPEIARFQAGNSSISIQRKYVVHKHGNRRKKPQYWGMENKHFLKAKGIQRPKELKPARFPFLPATPLPYFMFNEKSCGVTP